MTDEERFQLAEINGELNAWGKWVEAHLYYEGYPTRSAGMQLVSYSGGQYGDRILCLDMPARLFAIHQRILKLNDRDREIIHIWYVYRVQPDGTLWQQRAKAAMIGISENTYRQWVHRIRRELVGLSRNERKVFPQVARENLQAITA